MEDLIYKQYKKEFWEWFDSLDVSTKKRFWYYPGNAAFLYFCNKILPTKVIDKQDKV